jgi:hypothetical protein
MDTDSQTNFDRNADEQQMLAEILENTRKTKQYIKWQLIITVALVVLPLLAMAFIVPMILNSLSSVYGAAGLLQ